MSERYTQGVIPDEYFAPEAVGQFIAENPDSNDVLRRALIESARLLAQGEAQPRDMTMVRQFLVAMIGFGRGSEADL